MKKLIMLNLVLFLLLNVVNANAQTTTGFNYKKYNWSSDPKIHTLSEKEKEGNYVILKDKIIIEFAYEKSGDLVEYFTRHTLVHINNVKGIEEMNKVYISSYDIVEEMDLKARTITSAGKIIPLSKSSIKKIDNLENAGPFIIFAMEGVEEGCEIEYIYTNKKNGNIYGSMIMQNKALKKNVEIDIYSPKNLVYEAKSYNGFPNFVSDTTIKDKNHIYASIAQINALNEEEYSTYEASKMRIDYQLTYNKQNGYTRLYSWEFCGRNIYENLFNFSKVEQKSMEKLISKLGLNKIETDEQKIRTLEQYAKINLVVNNTNTSIDNLIDLKYGDVVSFQRLFIGIAKLLNIPVEAIVTTNREVRKFDPSFASINSLKEYLIYFPSLNKYLSPTSDQSRLGFPPSELTFNKGLFVKETSIGDTKTGVTKIKQIEPLSYLYSKNNIKASVTFNNSTLTPVVSYIHDFYGYMGVYIQSILFYLDENQRNEILKNYYEFLGKESVTKSSKISGYEPNDILTKPFVVEGIVEVSHLVENAGNKILFKVGSLIGRQMELYQEKERQTDIEISYTHSFTRDLEIKIPQGFKVNNLKDLLFDKKFEDNGKVLASFSSNYTIENDIIKVHIYEDYQAIFYDKSKFEQFRQVVNAAADFNKAVLIFEKL